MKYLPLLLLCASAFLAGTPAKCAPKGDTLDDLKKLDIICLVPGWLPEGYHLRKVDIDYSDREGLDDPKARGFPGYSLEYSDGKKGLFTVDCARWGIGDRNLDPDDRAEESQFDTKDFGPIYIIYFPPGKKGVKKRITAEWIQDSNMRADIAKNPTGISVTGRFHGVSGYGMTLAEYQKIVQSLHPIRVPRAK
jgi:hypothetical protein